MPLNAQHRPGNAAAALPAALHEALQGQERAARQLLLALQQETAALAGRSAEGLREAVSRKELAVRALEAAEAVRREAMAREGFTPATPGVEGPWGSILELLRHCRDLNEANGQLALRRAQQVNGALQVLRGGAPQPATYSNTLPGTAVPRSRPRPLAWA